MQLQQRYLSLMFAEMGYPEASRDEARRIPAVSVRLLSEILGRLDERPGRGRPGTIARGGAAVAGDRGSAATAASPAAALPIRGTFSVFRDFSPVAGPRGQHPRSARGRVGSGRRAYFQPVRSADERGRGRRRRRIGADVDARTCNGWRTGGTASPRSKSATCGVCTAAKRRRRPVGVATGPGALARARRGQRRPGLLATAISNISARPRRSLWSWIRCCARPTIAPALALVVQLARPGRAGAAGRRRLVVSHAGAALDAGGRHGHANDDLGLMTERFQDSRHNHHSPMPRSSIGAS